MEEPKIVNVVTMKTEIFLWNTENKKNGKCHHASSLILCLALLLTHKKQSPCGDKFLYEF